MFVTDREFFQALLVRRWRRRRWRRARFVLWGARYGDLTYEFVTTEFAYRCGLAIVGTHDVHRDTVTVARRML